MIYFNVTLPLLVAVLFSYRQLPPGQRVGVGFTLWLVTYQLIFTGMPGRDSQSLSLRLGDTHTCSPRAHSRIPVRHWGGSALCGEYWGHCGPASAGSSA